MMKRLFLLIFLGFFCFPSFAYKQNEGEKTLLNVSYDSTREFYKEFNQVFEKYYLLEKGMKIKIRQSHGGSSKQARAVITGLRADVVTLASAYDVNNIYAQTREIVKNWQSLLPNNSCPYNSTIIFLVRKGNPKKINDWSDLIKDKVEVILPNPKTSGAAQWSYLAAWGYAVNKKLGSLTVFKEKGKHKEKILNAEIYAKQYMRDLFKNVHILDVGARGAMNTFINRGIGDVLVTWEDEALFAVNKLNTTEYDIVIPSLSILAEPPVTIVDGNVNKRATKTIAIDYLNYLYSVEGQKLAAKYFYRPYMSKYANRKDTDKFANIKLFKITDIYTGWDEAYNVHFADNAIFDQIYQIH